MNKLDKEKTVPEGQVQEQSKPIFSKPLIIAIMVSLICVFSAEIIGHERVLAIYLYLMSVFIYCKH